ncbi:hypothetical protein V493_07015 [Pseudogymnoascus sp. VKM F-4281 (FW-2241)]|nr:hypothetical protein V493_07015 [Pseudogymnoascus sp. VKM F-4281 (FW-2241)]
MKNASMEDSVSTFEEMMEHRTDILPELMSVTHFESFVEKFQQLPKPDLEDGDLHYRVRIDGVTTAYSGFMLFVDKVLRPKSVAWQAIIWGSAVFILKFSCETPHGRHKSLLWLENLSIMIALPRLGEHIYIARGENRIASETLQIFNDLFCSLGAILKLLISEPHIFSYSERNDDSASLEVEAKADKISDEASTRLRRQAASLSKLFNSLGAGTASNILHAKLPYREIPFARDKHFYGREEYLQQIHDALQLPRKELRVVSLHGLPGVGKTQLAAEYVHRFGLDYQAVIWVTSDNRVKLSDGLANAATNLALDGCNAMTDSTTATKAILSWLKHTNETWLVVFDNVDNMKLLHEFWPIHCIGNVIMTSRDSFTSYESQITNRIRLEPLCKEQSYELFCKTTCYGPGTKCPPELNHFLDQWGGMPIALAQIGGYIRQNQLTMNDFIEIYAQSASLLHAEKPGTWQYEHSIATAFAIDKLDAQPKEVLYALTFFDPERIPLEHLLHKFDTGNTFASLKTKYFKASGDLRRKALFTINDKKEINVHRLVQAIVWDSMDEQQRESSFDTALGLLLREFPKETKGRPMYENWSQCERLLPHVLFLLARFRDHFPKGHKSAQLAELLGPCTWFLFESGHFGQVAELVETLETTCLEKQKAILATAIFIRAGLCADNNRVKEADLLIKQCIKLREEVLEPTNPDLCNTYYSAGIISMECDRHEESFEYHNKAIAVRNNCGDDDQTQTAVAFQNLALLYVKQKLLDDAEKCLNKAKELCKGSSGANSDRYAEVLFDMGNLRLSQNKMTDGLDIHQEALQIREKITPQHFKTGLSFHKVASILYEMGNLSKAKKHIESAMQIFESTWDSAPRLARASFLRGQVLEQMGEHVGAEKARLEAVRFRETITTFPTAKIETMEAYDKLVNSWFR